ncbi:10731_t:CDS:2, partial [Funneliformis geosporum]
DKNLKEDYEKSEVFSQSSRIQKIKLKKPISTHNIMIKTGSIIFQIDLARSYKSFGCYASLINKNYNFYENASYILNEEFFEVKCHLYKNDVVTIQADDHDKGYAIIKAIFKHKGNDGHYYSFIYVDWFEDTNKKHAKVNCPLFILRLNDDSQRKIFPLTVVDGIQKTHFILD